MPHPEMIFHLVSEWASKGKILNRIINKSDILKNDNEM